MALSKRLQCVSDMVSSCNVACDVGCDHGFVSIDLVKSGKAKKVFACDIKEGPVESAHKNIDESGVKDSIEIRLGDGLHPVNVSDGIDAIVIAGMGTRVMIKILTEGRDIVKNSKELVLQPQSEWFMLREFLRNEGYSIVEEKMVLDEGKYYVIMRVNPNLSPNVEKVDEMLKKVYDYYSYYLVNKKDPILKEYLEIGIKKDEEMLPDISERDRESFLEKLQIKKTAYGLLI